MEDASYNNRMNNIEKYEMGILMRHKADEERLERDLVDRNMPDPFTSDNFKPALDKMLEGKRKATGERREAIEEQMSMEEQPKTFEGQISSKRGQRSSTDDEVE